MAETINSNVFDANKKFVDLSGLDYFWSKAKTYIDGVDATMSAKIVALEETVGDQTKGLVQKVNLIQGELDGLNGGAGSITTQIENAISALDLPNSYDVKGAAAQALEDAKADAEANYQVKGDYEIAGTAAGLNSAMDARVKILEAIDHSTLASDAAASAVATILDGAPEKFDTLKEVADWIADSESASSAADLVTRVGALEAINHDAYIAADTALETSLKGYVDGKVDGKFDTVGSAAQALEDAKADAEANYQVKGNYETAGAAAQALADAKAYVNGKVDDKFDAIGSADAAKTAAIAQAKLDAVETLKSYYTKTEVDNLLSSNSEGDRAYAKQYTDALYNSFSFASNSDVDGLFAVN